MTNARILFMGTPEFALPSLQMLAKSSHRIEAVVTPPDRRRGRGLKLTFSPVKKFARRAGMRVLQPTSLKEPQFRSDPAVLNADLIVTVAYGKILPPELLALPPRGAINLHASLLPAYRGAAPINRAIMEGATTTGVTVIRMSSQLDGGDIIAQATEPILADDTAGSLHDRLALAGSRLLLEAVEALVKGTAVFKRQDPAAVSYASPLRPEEERVDWALNCRDLYNHIRGLSPYPGAYTGFKGKRLKLLAVSPPAAGETGCRPGEVLGAAGEKITVAVAGGTMDLLKVQPQGRAVMTAGDFSRGYHVGPGCRFD